MNNGGEKKASVANYSVLQCLVFPSENVRMQIFEEKRCSEE